MKNLKRTIDLKSKGGLLKLTYACRIVVRYLRPISSILYKYKRTGETQRL